MPLIYQQEINGSTRLGVWKIEEPEEFFLRSVPLSSSILHPHKRLQHLAGRYLLANLFPGFPYHEIVIADTRKPFLPSEAYHFSISHCAEYAAAIVSTSSRVGVDVEVVGPRVQKVKHKFLHPDELQFVQEQGDSKLQLLTLMWSAKEAMFKWYSYGEIDFSEMLKIDPFRLREYGSFDACISKANMQARLQMHYRIINGLSLVWVVTDA